MKVAKTKLVTIDDWSKIEEEKRMKKKMKKKIRHSPNSVSFCKFFVVVGCTISRCLSATPHPMGGQGGSILIVHKSVIILKPAILELMAVVRYDHIPIYNSLSCVSIQSRLMN